MAETDKDDLVTIIDEEDHQDIVPDILPLMPVRDVVIFTDMLLPLFVGRKKSIRAVEEALTKDGYLLLATQKDPNVEDPGADDIYTVGTVGRILRMLKLPDGRAKTLVQGVSKVKIKRYVRKRGFYRVKIEALEEVPLEELNIEVEALMRNVREFSEKILALRGELTSDVSAILESIENPGKLADLVASNLKLKIDEAQEILETIDPVQRLEKVNTLLSREMNLSAIQAKIQSEVKDEISKNQRDYFLREQMRAINRELGEGDDRAQEIEDYQKKIRKSGMPKEARDEAGKQLRRLEQMHSDSAEAAIIRTYLDWMVEVPWQKSTKDMLDIAYARKVLDREHYGLSKIKDRILEYLSVRKLNPKMKGPILCLVGPPGVGKTSLGQAIAKAMKRKFVRLSLGGIHDEAEIRGHRRTYIGALPGRIIQGLKQCKVNNPIFMMDEIDKLGSDFRGDPSSALLEALDPEQNSAFSDHYLNLPFDLSNVMFILTANLTDTIPSPLLDRMEVINLSGYTEEEKHKIATDYLLPRQIKNNGLTARTIRFSDGAIQQMITEYTLEAGLRNLEREFGTICRKVARKIAEGRKGPYSITQKNLSRYLGPPSFQAELDKDESQVGLVTGLAWTQTGGEVLYVETSMLPGKGELIMTGQLGDVMQESGRAAMSYARANLERLGVDRDIFENFDFHIHAPAGAIPKDGPSAGIAMATGLISVLTGRAVNKDVAMTGEISLRGRVLPIGGLKEKAMGALRGKVFTVIIPEKNRKDLIDIPANVKRKLKFVIVRHMDEVLKIALEPAPVSKTKPTAARKKPAKKRTAAAKRK
ncbi:MAG: endopeptidase La [Desulfobacteraceae bacterium]|nr:endopeptidase La [Desulfobacteraceae bacterium]MBC2753708.1 endopeptidase La [Desulfobacteraceae bacterium]